MNNRYIFRGKREDNGDWVEGDLMQWNDGTVRICVEDGDNKKKKNSDHGYPRNSWAMHWSGR